MYNDKIGAVEHTIGINVLKWCCETVGFLFVTKYVDWDNPHFTPGDNTNFLICIIKTVTNISSWINK